MAKDTLELDLEQLLGNPEMGDIIADSEKTEKQEEDDFLEYDINSAFENATEEEENTDDSKEQGEKAPSKTGSKEKIKNTDESSVSIPLAFARYQLERGTLTELDEEELQKVITEDGEDAAYAYLFKQEVERNVEAARNDLLDQYEPEVREYLQLREAGLDVNDAKNLTRSKKFYDEINYDQIEEDKNEGLRAQILKDYYKKTTKFNDKKIDKLIESHVSLGEDIDLAKEYAKELQGFYEEEIKSEKIAAQKQQQDFEKENASQLELLKKRVEEKEEILPGYKINKQTKDKIFEMIVKPVAQDKQGNPLNAIWNKRAKDPFTFDVMVAYLDILGVFDGKIDKLLKPAQKESINSLSNVLKTSGKFGSRPAGLQQKDQTDALSSLGALLNIK